MKKQAFTLIEVLTVIAIIAILAAIIFPVYSRTKLSAYRNGDIANMNQLRTALGLYRADQGAYPPQLLGYVTLYSSGPQAGSVIPAGSVKGYVYPTRVDSILALKPGRISYGDTDFTGTLGTDSGVVFPAGDSTAVGTSPIVDTDGNGIVNAADDIAGARQAYGPGDGSVCWHDVLGAVAAGNRCTEPAARPINFYRVSGYDVYFDKVAGGGNRNELRYSRFWTNFTIGDAPFGGGSAFDDPRQLGYNDPPEDTVVTWNTNYREYNSVNVVKAGRQDIALTLGGAAKPVNSTDFSQFAWRQRR